MGTISHVIEAPSENYEARPNSEDSNALNYSASKRYGRVNHADMLAKIRERRPSRVAHSDGFLSFSHIDWENRDCRRGHPVENGKCVNCGLERSY